jgi:hypothetical protein
MNCRTYRKNLEDYLEGGLDFPSRFGMERHAQECICCGKELSDAQKLRAMAHGLQRVSAPPDFEAKVLRRIHAEGRRDRFWSIAQNWTFGVIPSPRILAFSASGLVVLAGLGFLISYRYPQSSAPAESPVAAIREPAPSPTPQAIEGPELSAVSVKSASVSKPSKRQEVAPLALIPRHSNGNNSTLGNSEPVYAEAADQDVVGLPVPGPDSSQQIMLLPKALKVRNEPPSEDYFIRNVSH